MADRTVRAVFEARVSDAKKNIVGFGKDVAEAGQKVDGLTKDLKTLDSAKVKPEIDVKIEDAKKRLTDLTRDLAELKAMEPSPEVDVKIEAAKAAIKDVRAEIKDLTGQKAEVRVEASIQDAQKRVKELTLELGELRTMEATPQVTVDIKEAQKRLRDAKSELRELRGAKAEMKVTVDVDDAKGEIAALGDEGDAVGDDIGEGMVSGIISALGTIPIAGAVVGAGAAIAGGIILGIKQGLAIDAERDLFGARTGLDEKTAAKFGRAAGEAYSQAWGESIASNLETARVAMEQGLLDPDAVEAEVERVISSLTGIADLMQQDIPAAARAAGQMIKTGLVDGPDEAFDVLVAGYQNGADASQDLLDTLIEYPTHFRDLGLSAQDAMGLLIQGMDGGAFNADKVADSLKELTIKVKELDSTAGPALQKLGLDGKAMSAAFAEGGPAAREALQQILDGLRSIEDPAERSRMAVALFGTQAEDMAGALGALDLSKAAAEIGGVEGAAGAAERALARMSDNTASKIESAKRNVEVAMDGIKGALAEAFGDEISGVADWVSRNRAPLMQFFLDVMNGAIDTAGAFAEFGAAGLEAVAGIADGMSKVLYLVPGMSDTARALGELADGTRSGATALREDLPAALDATQAKMNDWAGPELMKARIHDATLAMTADIEDFSARVSAAGGTITINGDTMTAEQALNVLVENINGEDGTVTINGDKVPAAEALDAVLAEIAAGSENVTIGGDAGPARAELEAARAAVRAAEDNIRINGDTAKAQAQLDAARARVRAAEDSIKVSADTSAAERRLAELVRYRVAEIGARVAGVTGQGGQTRHDGGWIQKGLNAGGWVPGSDPGYDNILWPLNSGGRTLGQPLAGGEMVVNSKDAAFWGPVLEWMNGGGRPRSGGDSSTTATDGIDYGRLAAALERGAAAGTSRGMSALASAASRDIPRGGY